MWVIDYRILLLPVFKTFENSSSGQNNKSCNNPNFQTVWFTFSGWFYGRPTVLTKNRIIGYFFPSFMTIHLVILVSRNLNVIISLIIFAICITFWQFGLILLHETRGIWSNVWIFSNYQPHFYIPANSFLNSLSFALTIKR